MARPTNSVRETKNLGSDVIYFVFLNIGNQSNFLIFQLLSGVVHLRRGQELALCTL